MGMKKFLNILLIGAFFIIVSNIDNKAFAGFQPPFGGEYTNLCGSGTEATSYNCQAECNIYDGYCKRLSGQWIYSYLCEGQKLTDCNSSELEFGSQAWYDATERAFLFNRSPVGPGNTVKIAVYNKKCRNQVDNSWHCSDENLLGYIVWYSKLAAPLPLSCNIDEVSMSISPSNTVKLGNSIIFNVSGNSVLNFWRNEFSGGVVNCVDYMNGLQTRCSANSVGTFSWTRRWKNCNSTLTNCSGECSKTITFKIEPNIRLPVIITLPAVATL